MSAIITDQLRISNASSFVEKLISANNSYYSFIGLSNTQNIKSNWDQSPPSPRDSFDDENDFWDTIISLKKIKNDDVRQLVRKIEWNSGDIYDMYRHDISREFDQTNGIDKRSKPSNSTTLYSANYYVVNSDFKVYICLYNGASPENNFQGNPSLDEPTFTDLDPRPAGTSGDGYIWKYLYTIKPSEIIKFDSINYIPVPRNWGQDGESLLMKNNAQTSGQLKIATIRNRGRGLGEPRVVSNVSIDGNGTGGLCTIIIGSDSRVESISITSGGSGYTFGHVNWQSAGIISSEENPEFDVIIPPQGGHGYNIYRELGAYYVLVYSRYENAVINSDFVIGGKISRIGLVESPKSKGSLQLLNSDTANATYALKLKGISPNDEQYKETTFITNSIITQTIDSNTIAVGRVISYDQETGILRYTQDRSLVGFNYNQTKDYNNQYKFKINEFSSSVGSGSLIINGGSNDLEIDTSFGSAESPVFSINNINLGQSFIRGIAYPEVEKYKGNIIYVDHRPSILRTINQKEDIKIVLQF